MESPYSEREGVEVVSEMAYLVTHCKISLENSAAARPCFESKSARQAESVSASAKKLSPLLISAHEVKQLFAA